MRNIPQFDQMMLKESLVRAKWNEQIRLIKMYIDSAIQPFDSGLVEVRVVSDPIRTPVIIVTSSTFIDDVFTMDGRDLYYLGTEDLMVQWIGQQSGKFFLSCMDETDIPNNIVLGEY